jgi:hypothetical protein
MLKLQLGEQSFKPARMPARFHSHTHLHLLCRQVTVEFLRFLAVLQSPLLQFPSLGIYKCGAFLGQRRGYEGAWSARNLEAAPVT